MPDLSKLHVAIIATDGVEEAEIVGPLRTLRDCGAFVEILSDREDQIQVLRHLDKTFRLRVHHVLKDEEAFSEHYDALVLPGGIFCADRLRTNPYVLAFIHEFEDQEKPVGTLGYAPWLLISAHLVRGRKLAGNASIADDVQNAGGIWLEQEVVVDRNWVTGQSSALPRFHSEMIELFSRASPLMSYSSRHILAKARIA